MKIMKGIIPALVTPFDEKNQVDCGALKELVEYLLEQQVSGFYVCGSTGECFLMDMQERMRVVETVLESVHGRVPVVVHVGSMATENAILLAKHAAAHGADFVSSVPPFYYSFSQDEINSYYTDISAAVDLPIIVYNIPAFSGVSFNAENIRKLFDSCNIWGLKYTAYDLFELERIHRGCPKLALFYGHDELFLNALPIGLHGAIGSTYNIMPQKFSYIWQMYKEGEMKHASVAQAQANEIIDTLIECGVISSIKYLLSKRGIPCGNCRAPFSTLSPAKSAKLDALSEILATDTTMVHA